MVEICENSTDDFFRRRYICFIIYVSSYYSSDRLVDCTSLKRAIEFVYSATLPQASKPFIYMSINLPPEHVDVNIHPTKKEVHFETSF
jgi:DNA mismatch repair ATPase MutL